MQNKLRWVEQVNEIVDMSFQLPYTIAKLKFATPYIILTYDTECSCLKLFDIGFYHYRSIHFTLTVTNLNIQIVSILLLGLSEFLSPEI